MKRLLIVVIIIVLVISTFLIFIYSGSYNISAMVPHYGITRWVISTVMDNSVRHHAKDVKAPNLNDSLLVKSGFSHYNMMCAGCHGSPVRDQGEMAKSFYPRPPLLVKAIVDWSPSELFWITKNGIKMTGMPAFGRTHSDKDIWALVAFMEKLPRITKEQYQSYADAVKNNPEWDEHRH
jgi:mono/diheme cytochrome c family protein